MSLKWSIRQTVLEQSVHELGFFFFPRVCVYLGFFSLSLYGKSFHPTCWGNQLLNIIRASLVFLYFRIILLYLMLEVSVGKLLYFTRNPQRSDIAHFPTPGLLTEVHKQQLC